MDQRAVLEGHLDANRADVERWWFRHSLLGEEGVPLHSTAADPDGDFTLVDGVTTEWLLADYARAGQDSRAIAARRGLDDACQRPRRDGARPSLRWVYAHMIEELARQLGHLDIYRELLDGQTDRG